MTGPVSRRVVLGMVSSGVVSGAYLLSNNNRGVSEGNPQKKASGSTESMETSTTLETQEESSESYSMVVAESVASHEHVRLPQSTQQDSSICVGHQIRLDPTIESADSAIYTVVEFSEDIEQVQLSSGGRSRLTNSETSVVIRKYGSHPSYTTDSEAATHSELVDSSESGGDRTDVLAIAPHGGYIEYNTDDQVRLLGEQFGVDTWWAAGYNEGGGAFDKWHISSTDIHPESFDSLQEVSQNNYSLTVSLHGFSGSGVVIGGGACRDVQEKFRDEIQTQLQQRGLDREVRLTDDESIDGDSDENIVNWLTESNDGVQIEQSWDVRDNHWEAVVDGVGAVIEKNWSN